MGADNIFGFLDAIVRRLHINWLIIAAMVGFGAKWLFGFDWDFFGFLVCAVYVFILIIFEFYNRYNFYLEIKRKQEQVLDIAQRNRKEVNSFVRRYYHTLKPEDKKVLLKLIRAGKQDEDSKYTRIISIEDYFNKDDQLYKCEQIGIIDDVGFNGLIKVDNLNQHKIVTIQYDLNNLLEKELEGGAI